MIRRCWLFVFGLLVLGLPVAGLLLAAPASAHATVISSDPGDGARLKSAPRTVTVTFDESVGIGGIGYLHVTDASGKRVDARPAYHPGGDQAKVADDLTGGLGDGSYTESYRVISADSHPVAGTIRFVVGNGALVHGSASGSASDPVTSAALDVVRWVSYAGVALLGGSWLLLTIWLAGRDDRRATRIVWLGWGAATLGAVLELLIQGPFSAGDGLAKITDTSLLDVSLHIDYGLLHSVRLVLLGLIALLLARSLQAGPRRARWNRWDVSTAVLGLGVLETFAGSGHAATTSPAWLSSTLDVLHLGSMAVWLGGLVLLVGALLPRHDSAELHAVLPGFSRVAFVSVVVLAGSGTYAAWRGVGTVHAVFTTNYGLLVVAKIVLFVGLLALGNLSRHVVQGGTVAHAMTDAALDEVSVERLRRSVYVEAIVAVIVLALTAVLVGQPRGKEALAITYRDPVSATASLGAGRSVTVTADPGTHGPVDVTIALSSGAASSTASTTASTTGQSITATAVQKAAEIGPLPIALAAAGGRYTGSVVLPVSGRWEFDLVVTTSAFDATTTDVVLDLH